MPPLTPAENRIFRSLSNPKKIQDFLNTLGKRVTDDESYLRSPRNVLRAGTANCLEGALLAAAALIYHGHKAYLLDLKVDVRNENDVDHVVAVFKKNGCFGALSQTRHAVLRYREPVYKTLRELALSYFHEYFTDDGKKTLRTYSKLFDIQKEFGTDWIISGDSLSDIAVRLDDSPHKAYLTKEMARDLRLADPIEIAAGKIVE